MFGVYIIKAEDDVPGLREEDPISLFVQIGEWAMRL